MSALDLARAASFAAESIGEYADRQLRTAARAMGQFPDRRWAVEWVHEAYALDLEAAALYREATALRREASC